MARRGQWLDAPSALRLPLLPGRQAIIAFVNKARARTRSESASSWRAPAKQSRHRGPNCSAAPGGHHNVYEGGASFADVLRTEVDFLHRHAKTAAQKLS
jgi:hypothetical protein